MTNLLEIQGLNTFYGESHILRDVDLSVKSGEMVCLIGRKFQSPRVFEKLSVQENLALAVS